MAWMKLNNLHRTNITALFLLAVALSTILYFTTQRLQSDILVYRVGGNLRPSSKNFLEKLTRAPLVFKCAYTTCSMKPGSNRPRNLDSNGTAMCPSYFKWIQEDLGPWKGKGITRKLLKRAQKFASFRVIIIKSRLFLEPYHPCYQTRALFTVWGMLQLLQFYPNLVPDVDLMFSCEDQPQVFKQDFSKKMPPPVLRYCSTPDFFDIPFPDWSFWGWPEIGLGDWPEELLSILKGSNTTLWEDKRPTTQWKGNPFMAGVRMNLLRCNSSAWNAEIFPQDWIAEGASGFISSNLSNQCKYRYKIYVEGSGWSVSQKYILACGSTMLSISPRYHDFFSRGLMPLVTHWPVRSEPDKMCNSIKFAVDWGNAHPEEAKSMGRAGQEFSVDKLSMKHVYDYMLYVLRGYAAVQRFKPAVPEKAAEVCSHSILCLAEQSEKPAMEHSLVKEASREPPCKLENNDDDDSEENISKLKEKQATNLKKVRDWEDSITS